MPPSRLRRNVDFEAQQSQSQKYSAGLPSGDLPSLRNNRPRWRVRKIAEHAGLAHLASIAVLTSRFQNHYDICHEIRAMTGITSFL
ncbi:MAG: hypothetical protein ABSD75_21635 [Terriglobales bacterium]|jgi:hypothetical protein